MASLPSASWITTGRFSTTPIPRIATCGWLMMRDFLEQLLSRPCGPLQLALLVAGGAEAAQTYRVRGAEVEEILLPSSPLGGLGHQYGRATLALQPEDVVWLSDGLIEATNGAGEPFGYDAAAAALAGEPGQSAADVRNRLLAAVERHAAGEPASDDRTLMVMRYGGAP